MGFAALVHLFGLQPGMAIVSNRFPGQRLLADNSSARWPGPGKLQAIIQRTVTVTARRFRLHAVSSEPSASGRSLP
jgi:hypothetical protein